MAGLTMSPSSHAFLSPSAAHRWVNCPPSARLSSQFPDEPSPFAIEGTQAHELCEYKIRRGLGRPAADPVEHLSMYGEEMEECASGFANFVLEKLEEARKACPSTMLATEQRVIFDKWVPQGSGTSDVVIVSDDLMEIIDFKSGSGVLVDARGNEQTRCYAIGAYEMFGSLYDIRKVRMTIYQPRRNNVSSEELTVEELLDWAENVLKPAAILAHEGKGEFKAGAWCRFCKARNVCRARAEANLALARHDFALPETLGDEEIAVILGKLDALESWANDIREYALKSVLGGKQIHGWKLVEGRAVRKYADEAAVAMAVSDAGYDPYEKRLLGITAMTKMLGKKQFEELLGGLLVRPQGKPALAPEDDPRPAMNTANIDFMEN